MDEEAALDLARTRGASYADVRIETVEEGRLKVQDGELRDLASGSITGFALRVLVDGAWGFASANDPSPETWRSAVDTALRLGKAAAATSRHKVRLAEAPTLRAKVQWRPKRDPRNVELDEQFALLRDAASAVRAFPELVSVTTATSHATEQKRFLNSDGTRLEWSVVRCLAQVHATVKRGGRIAGRSAKVAGTAGWELFAQHDLAQEATRNVQATLDAMGAPSPKGGKQTVVIDHELAGVFAHEAVGHASEADLIAAGESCFKGRLGERLGPEGLSIRDDSTIAGAWGSFPFDDNGIPGGSKTILESGVLVGFLADREHGAELGVRPNGAARAEDHHARPLVRMSNTMIDAGDVPEDEVFAGVKDGVYCKGSRGGQVDCARGTFLFNAEDAFRIEDGVVTTPLRDVSLTGDILATLHGIDALGDKQRMGNPGYCGKGQWVPVCDGGPLVRIRDCLVGGAA